MASSPSQLFICILEASGGGWRLSSIMLISESLNNYHGSKVAVQGLGWATVAWKHSVITWRESPPSETECKFFLSSQSTYCAPGAVLVFRK